MTPLAKETLRLARQALEARVHEERGPNRGRWVRVYQTWARIAEGSPWCVAFALYKVHQAAKRLGIKSRLPVTGSSSALYRWYRKNGGLLERPVAGCIGMVKGGPTGHSHTFLVEGVGDSRTRGIDGNWKDAVSESNRRIETCHYGAIK